MKVKIMYKIVDKKVLKANISQISIKAPLVALNAKPGQFIILRVNEQGERIPLTIFDVKDDVVTILFQVVGATTRILNNLYIGDYLLDFVGPLGKAIDLENINKVIIVGGGIGTAIAYPIAKKLFQEGADVTTVIGFRSEDYVILEDEFKNVSNKSILTTDDGSYGQKGFATNPLEQLLKQSSYDKVIAIGPLVMMENVSKITKKFNVETIVSLNSIMIDGTGMCGGCRVVVDGKTRFACVEGPDFDGHLVDFDEAMKRGKAYEQIEKEDYEHICFLLGDEDEKAKDDKSRS